MTDAVWRIFCGALVCAAAAQLGGAGQGIRKLLCGAFLTALILASFGKVDFAEVYQDIDGCSQAAQAAVEEGEAQAQALKDSIITEQYEAYILDKAAELGAQVTVTVTLEPQTGLPCAAVITGNLTPWEKQTLSGQITQALGIEKEALDWKS